MENKATKFIPYGENKHNWKVFDYPLCLTNLQGNSKSTVMWKLSHLSQEVASNFSPLWMLLL